MTLRTLASSLTVLVTAIALVVSGALILSTSYHRKVTTTLEAAVESVRIANKAEIDLLLHSRASGPVEKTDIEEDLLSRLEEARKYVSDDREQRVLATAETRAKRYFATSAVAGEGADLSESYRSAYEALDLLVTENINHSRTARQNATRWDELASTMGFSVVVVLILFAGSVVWWLRTRAFQPVFALANAMNQFSRGDRNARVEERGASELRDMARRFNEMASALVEQRDAQMAFLAGVAHDLRNPLSALAVSVGSFPADGSLPPEKRLRHSFEVTKRQLTRLNRMVGDLLDMARIESGQLELQLQPHDTRTLVRNVIELFESTPLEHRILVSLPDGPVQATCDSLRVEQVVTNLLSNAMKYSPSGRNIEVSVRQYGREARIAVRDHGVGISPDDQQRLFEPFQRGQGHQKETIPGVGLGLFTVQRIVRAHGGSIQVRSAPGAGTTFEVCLPLAPNDTRENRTPAVSLWH